MADVADLLQGLHPLREPPPIAPITPYLGMCVAGMALAVALVVTVGAIRRRRVGMRRTAQAALAASRGLEGQARLAAQAQLLRRLVRARRGETAARADGAAWLAALDRTFATTFFTQGGGRVFADALYRRAVVDDIDGIDRDLSRLIARMRA